MIGDVIKVLKDALNTHVALGTGFDPSMPMQNHVVFYESDTVEAIEFKANVITMLVVNIEEDRKVLPADPYRRTTADGTTLLVNAPVPLNLYVLFVAKFTKYIDGLNRLSLLIQFFQKHRAIDTASLPDLPSSVERLGCDLVSFPVSETNHVWGMLNTAYQPSLLYRIRMVVFHDMAGIPVAAPSGAPSVGINQ